MRNLVLVHLLALTGAVIVATSVHTSVLRDTAWNLLFFSYNWWGTHFMVKWVSRRMRRDRKRAIIEIYLDNPGWKVQLNFLNVERILIERSSFSHKQGV